MLNLWCRPSRSTIYDSRIMTQSYRSLMKSWCLSNEVVNGLVSCDAVSGLNLSIGHGLKSLNCRNRYLALSGAGEKASSDINMVTGQGKCGHITPLRSRMMKVTTKIGYIHFKNFHCLSLTTSQCILNEIFLFSRSNFGICAMGDRYRHDRAYLCRHHWA